MASKGAAKEERRKQQRRHIYFYSRVFDENTHELAGRLVDISREGMMLVSDRPIEADLNFKFKLVFPSPISGKKALVLEARSRWSKNTGTQDLFDNGFELINVSIQNARMIDGLLKNTGLNYRY